MNYKFATLIGVLAAAAFASATASATASAQVSAKFRTLSWAGAIEDLYYDRDNKSVQIVAYDYARSPFYHTSAGQKLTFYRFKTAPDGTQVKESAAQVTLTPENRHVLLLFVRGPDGTLRVLTAPDDTSSFPAGSYRFVNMSKTPMSVALGSKPTPRQLAPGQSLVLPGQPERTGGVPVRVAALGEINQLFYSSKWLWNGDHRTLVFIAPTGNAAAPFELRRITENANFQE